MTSEAIEKIKNDVMRKWGGGVFLRPGMFDVIASRVRSAVLEEAAQRLAEIRKKRGDGLHGYDGENWWNIADEMEEAIRRLSGVAQEEK